LPNKDELDTLGRAFAARGNQEADRIFTLSLSLATRVMMTRRWRVRKMRKWKAWSRLAAVRKRQVVLSRLR
jgi:hypothetical protein